MDSFFTGWLLGLSIALPFGPVSMMCLHHSLSQGVLRAFARGAGAATTHGIYATLAMMGANAIAVPLERLQQPIHLFSAIVFIALGLRTIWRLPPLPHPERNISSSWGDYAGGIALALANPMSLLPYIAFVGTGALSTPVRGAVQLLAVAGIGLGTLSWYWTISSSAWLFRHRLPRHLLHRLNLLSGAILIGMGLVTALP